MAAPGVCGVPGTEDGNGITAGAEFTIAASPRLLCDADADVADAKWRGTLPLPADAGAGATGVDAAGVTGKDKGRVGSAEADPGASTPGTVIGVGVGPVATTGGAAVCHRGGAEEGGLTGGK